MSLRDAGTHLDRLGVVVLGISPDSPQAQKQFASEQRLGFLLLSDPDHRVPESYGVWGPKTKDGKTFEGIHRSSFLIDQEGSIVSAWYEIAPEATVPEALKVLEA